MWGPNVLKTDYRRDDGWFVKRLIIRPLFRLLAYGGSHGKQSTRRIVWGCDLGGIVVGRPVGSCP